MSICSTNRPRVNHIILNQHSSLYGNKASLINIILSVTFSVILTQNIFFLYCNNQTYWRLVTIVTFCNKRSSICDISITKVKPITIENIIYWLKQAMTRKKIKKYKLSYNIILRSFWTGAPLLHRANLKCLDYPQDKAPPAQRMTVGCL